MNDVILLKNKFTCIKNLGWVKSLRKGPTGVGYTFEKLLGKEEDFYPIPDFGNIEIKAHRKSSNYSITLFNATPDGENFFEIKRIYNKYGHYSSSDKKNKVLKNCAISNKLSNVGIWYKFSLFVSDFDKKVFLCGFDKNNILIDMHSFWSYEYLEERVLGKIKYLAFISADNKTVGGVEYYRYTDLQFYKLKSFSKFIDLVKKGKIIVTFKIDIFKNGNRTGQIHDHGTGFNINSDDLSLLYDRVF